MIGEAIVADDLRVESVGSDVRISMRVRFPAPMEARLWFELPEEFAPIVAQDGDPFLPVLASCAMGRGVSLEMDASVSPALLDGARRAMEVYCGWSDRVADGLKRVPLRAPEVVRAQTGFCPAAMFSGGADSLFTALRNRKTHPKGDPLRIQHLIIVQGFDVPLGNRALFKSVVSNAQTFAYAEGFSVVPARTNARGFVLPNSEWGRYGHGPCLAGAGHALAGHFHTVHISASYWPAVLFPWGSHPEVDPLWTSERTKFIHDGAETPRSEKMREISRSDAALETLRVCWKNRVGKMNCGECSKCLCAMASLACLGKLGQAALFPSALDPLKVEALRLSPAQIIFWKDELQLAKKCGEARLVGAVERLLERHGVRGLEVP